MAGVSRVGVEANPLVLGVVGLQRVCEPLWSPGLSLGIGGRTEVRYGLLKILIHQPAQEAEDPVPDQRGKGFGVAGDIQRCLLGSGRTHLFGFGAVVIGIAHFFHSSSKLESTWRIMVLR